MAQQIAQVSSGSMRPEGPEFNPQALGGLILPLLLVLASGVWYVLLWYYGTTASFSSAALGYATLKQWQIIVVVVVLVAVVVMVLWMYLNNWSVYKLPAQPGDAETGKVVAPSTVLVTRDAGKDRSVAEKKSGGARATFKVTEPTRSVVSVASDTGKAPRNVERAAASSGKRAAASGVTGALAGAAGKGSEAKVEVAGEQRKKGNSIVSYPHNVGGGIYYDTYMRIGTNTMLKLRSEVVEEIYLL